MPDSFPYPGLAKEITTFAASFEGPVIGTAFQNVENSPFAEAMGWYGCMKGSVEASIHPCMAPLLADTIDKIIFSIGAQDLEALKEKYGGATFMLAGCDTEACVSAVAMQMFESEMKIMVAKDLCGSSGGSSYHDWGLACLKRTIGTASFVNI